jgi:hypothetical protein
VPWLVALEEYLEEHLRSEVHLKVGGEVGEQVRDDSLYHDWLVD